MVLYIRQLFFLTSENYTEWLNGIILIFYFFENKIRYTCFRLHRNARFCYRVGLAESFGYKLF